MINRLTRVSFSTWLTPRDDPVRSMAGEMVWSSLSAEFPTQHSAGLVFLGRVISGRETHLLTVPFSFTDEWFLEDVGEGVIRLRNQKQKEMIQCGLECEIFQ